MPELTPSACRGVLGDLRHVAGAVARQRAGQRGGRVFDAERDGRAVLQGLDDPRRRLPARGPERYSRAAPRCLGTRRAKSG